MATKKNLPNPLETDLSESGGQRQRQLSRRTFIRTGLVVGGALVASAYVKPSLQSIGIPRAFAQATPPPGGNPSIEFKPLNDVEFDAEGLTSFTFTGVLLCNVSGDQVTPISDWFFKVTSIEKGSEFLDPAVDPDGDADGVELPDAASFPTLTSPQPAPQPDCAAFPVTFHLEPSWAGAAVDTEIKVKIDAFGTTAAGTGATHLTLTLIRK